ncbi:MAG TPA: hypothetical protein PKL84_10290, partial [Candidatus Hydrogenedentes bacterium]|nr:hypothetical protein [Candidatus Hydrogenedentota bacterium]
MRSDILAVLALVGLVVCATVHAGSLEADAKDLDAVMGALRAAGATDRPLLHRTGEGFIRYVGAPPGGYFAVDTATKSATPEASAQSFLDTHRKAFGLVSDRTRLRSSRTMALGDRAVVRMDQTYRGLRVFGAEMVVQVGGAGDVLSVASDVARDLRGLDEGAVSLLPRVDATAAAAKAKSAVAGRS